MKSKKLFFFIKLQYKSYTVEHIRVTYHVYDFLYEFLESQHYLVDEHDSRNVNIPKKIKEKKCEHS